MGERRSWRAAALTAPVMAALLALPLAGCRSAGPVAHASAAAHASVAAHVSASASSAPASSVPVSSAPVSSAPVSSLRRDPASVQALPRGGRAILGHYRVVAYYGAAGAPALGVLGDGTPEQEARSVIVRARGFTGYGLPVQPAMELIATVAQAAPGRDGTYSRAVPLATIRRYLAVAHRYRMLLILDLQPGRSTFLRQATALRSVLVDPSVSLGLDPEWKVTGTQRPGGGRIGSSRADDINRTARYLASLVRTERLPHKLLVVHEFTASMLPDRSAITAPPGVEITFHADGFGTPEQKVSVLHTLRFPGRPFGVGFKLFLHQDSRLMTPREVMRMLPRPDVITYQ